MSSRQYEQCAICGWTGERSDLDARDGAFHCPACDEPLVVE